MGRANTQQHPGQRDPNEDAPDIKDPPNDLPDYTDPPPSQPSDPTPPPVRARYFDPNDLSNYARDARDEQYLQYQSEMLYYGAQAGAAPFHMRDPLPSQIAYR